MFQLSYWQQTLIWKELFKYLHLTPESTPAFGTFFWPVRLSQNPPITPQLPLPHPCEADRTWHGIHVGDLSESPSAPLDAGALHCIANKLRRLLCWSVLCWLTERVLEPLAGLWQQMERFNFTSFVFFFTHPLRKENVKSIQEEMGP